MIDEQVSEKKLYRLRGILHLKLYNRAKRMDYNFTPYWKAPIDRMLKKSKIFVPAKLLDHREEEENDDIATMV